MLIPWFEHQQEENLYVEDFHQAYVENHQSNKNNKLSQKKKSLFNTLRLSSTFCFSA